MPSTRSVRGRSALAAIFMLSATGAFADDAHDDDAAAPAATPAPTRDVETTVVVTTGKEEEKLDVPATVSTVSAEEQKSDRGSWIGETVNKMPGVFFARLRGPIDAPSIRMPMNYSNYYLYLQDNVPFQSPVAFNHGAFAFSAYQTSAGGLEVLKGPGSALHGSDAMSAVINVRSAEPASEPHTEIELGGGSNAFREARVETGRGIGPHAFNVAMSYQGDDGYRENSGFERFQALARHRYTSGAGLVADTILMATDLDVRQPGNLDLATFESDPEDDGLQESVPLDDAHEQTRYYRLSSEVSRPLGDTTRLSVTPYVRRIDASYMAIWFPDTTPVTSTLEDSAGILGRVYHNFSAASETVFGVDVESTSLELAELQSRPDTLLYGYFDSPQGVHYDYEVSYLGLSPYVQHTQYLGEDWILVAGLRYDSIEYDYDNRAEGRTFGSYLRPDDRQDTFSALNPKLAITRHLGESQAVYLRYAHSFRIPSAYDLYNLDTGFAEFSLDPETIDSVELGYRGAIGETLGIEADVYVARTEDGVSDTNTTAGAIKQNGGEREFKGFELGIGWSPTERLRAGLSYAYSDHEILRKLAELESPEDGHTPRSAPRHLGNLRLTYRPAFLDGLSLSPELMYIGAWWADDLNTTRKEPDTVLNARAGYDVSDRYTVHVKVLNALDRQYATTAEDEGFGLQFRPAPGRTFAAGVGFRF